MENRDYEALSKRVEQNSFEKNSCLIYALLPFMKKSEADLAYQWITKLQKTPENEHKIRDDYAWLLMIQMGSNGNKLSSPFTCAPPSGTLSPISDTGDKEIYTKTLKELSSSTEKGSLQDMCLGKLDTICQNCSPEDFFSNLPRPSSGFQVYGSCFSKQYN